MKHRKPLLPGILALATIADAATHPILLLLQRSCNTHATLLQRSCNVPATRLILPLQRSWQPSQTLQRTQSC